MSEPTIAERARALARELEDPARWTMGYLARNADGASVDPDNDAATCWCAIGHAMRLFGHDPAIELDEVYENTNGESMAQANDGPGREFVRGRLLELADALEKQP